VATKKVKDKKQRSEQKGNIGKIKGRNEGDQATTLAIETRSL